ncbi:transmembrane protein 255B isoform X1 [Gadus chalcogrammus]|uniref:transmembrane protein 255B isoform X1 n=1 Tax=Gadus chalcogrammus TaxID=1042646 RepID=UPI0024C4C5C2|nr:transmembrane protein 255B isoform X1 [Gadus chalcogrammus]
MDLMSLNMNNDMNREAEVQVNSASKRIRTEVKARRALWLSVGMLCLSLLLVVLGIYTTTRTESLSITGYFSGAILAFGSFLGVLGLCLEENRKQLLTAAIVFLSLGIIAAFLCLVIDGVFIVFNMDIRPLKAGRCQFYTSGNSYIYENYHASVPCRNLEESCSVTIRSGTCYCCDLYDCANGGFLNNYYEFVGVRGCQDVLTLYILIWTLTSLNMVAFITGIVTAAVLGSVKSLTSYRPVTQSSEDRTSSPTAPLLLSDNPHSTQPLHLGGSLYPSLGSGRVTPQSDPSSPLETNPPPFAPLASRLRYAAQQGFPG